jgi:hypothetical protein
MQSSTEMLLISFFEKSGDYLQVVAELYMGFIWRSTRRSASFLFPLTKNTIGTLCGHYSVRFGASRDLSANQRKNMKDAHNKAAESHEAAAKSHRTGGRRTRTPAPNDVLPTEIDVGDRGASSA